MEILVGVCLPFLGTAAGAACAFFLRGELDLGLQKGLLGFAAGVMIAASVWSLLIPAMELASGMGGFSFFPAVCGLLLGVFCLLLTDRLVERLRKRTRKYSKEDERSGKKCHHRVLMLSLAVTLHNIPEGMAVGVTLAGLLSQRAGITLAGAMALTAGIAIQNFPEGAIISLPLRSGGKMGRCKAFLLGAASGIVEPVAAVITLLLAELLEPVLPYLLAGAAGAMLYVVSEELLPEAAGKERFSIGTLGFAFGFALMMALDVVFG